MRLQGKDDGGSAFHFETSEKKKMQEVDRIVYIFL